MANAFTKTAAIAVAAGMTLAGSAGIATNAIAQTRVTEPALATEVKKDASTIAEGNAFSLTVNKRINPTELRNGTGEVDENVKGTPLQGVEFTVRKLDGDIRKQEDFNRLAKLSQEYNKASAQKPGLTFDDGFTQQKKTTGTNGAAVFADLPAGAYLVTETAPANPAKATPVEDPAYEANGTETMVAADPFIVFLPMTNPTGDEWINDVNVYPKNSFVRVEKEVKDADRHAKVDGAEGETNNRQSVIEYTLTGRVPSAAEGKSLTSLYLRDSYNNSELTFQTDPSQDNYYVSKVEVLGADGSAKASLTRGEDYTVKDSVDHNPKVTDANAAFKISLTDAGLKKLAPNDKVVATILATMENAQDKEIVNGVDEGGTITRNPDGETKYEDEPFETPEDEVVTYLGDIEVFKAGEDKDGNRVALAGAKFEVGKCNSDETKIEGQAIASGTTNDQGKLVFEGLHVTDVIDGKVVDAPGKYCLRETKAPSGYSFDKDKVYPIELKKETKKGVQPEGFLDSTENQVAFYTDGGNAVRMNGVAVNNVKRNVPLLPATGGMGVLIIVLAGLAIIGGGVYAARRNSQSA